MRRRLVPDRLIIDRFGLNDDFIEAQGLTWIDNQETGSGGRLDDPRHPDHSKPYVQNYLRRFGVRKVEANALVIRPAAGRALCRQAIERYLPPDAERVPRAPCTGPRHWMLAEVLRQTSVKKLRGSRRAEILEAISRTAALR